MTGFGYKDSPLAMDASNYTPLNNRTPTPGRNGPTVNPRSISQESAGVGAAEWYGAYGLGSLHQGNQTFFTQSGHKPWGRRKLTSYTDPRFPGRRG